MAKENPVSSKSSSEKSEKIYEIRGRKFRLIKPEEITLFEMQKLGRVVKLYIEKGMRDGEFKPQDMILATFDIYESGAIVDIVATMLTRADIKTNRVDDYNFLYPLVETDVKPEDAKEIFEYFLNFIFYKLLGYYPYSIVQREEKQ